MLFSFPHLRRPFFPRAFFFFLGSACNLQQDEAFKTHQFVIFFCSFLCGIIVLFQVTNNSVWMVLSPSVKGKVSLLHASSDLEV